MPDSPDIRTLTTEQIQDVIDKLPSPSVVEAYGNAVWRNNPKAQQLMRQLTLARWALVYYLSFEAECDNTDIGLVTGWCQYKADELLSTGTSTVEGMLDD